MNMDLFSHQERSSKCTFNKLERNRVFHNTKFHVVSMKDKKIGCKVVYSFLRYVTSLYFTSFWVWHHVDRIVRIKGLDNVQHEALISETFFL